MPWARRRIPLAWLLLVRQPVRLAIALAGIGFAGILMFMQLGFRDGLFDASVTIHRLFDADLVLVSPRTMSSISMATFPEGRLVQSLADPDVAAMTPVQWEFVLWRNPQTRQTRSILALGFDPEDPLLSDPAVRQQAPLLRLPGRLLFDERSRPEFGPVAEWFRAGRSVQTEVSGQRLRVAGLVQLGPSFGADGNMLVSRETFRTIAPPGSRGGIQLGLLRLRQGADPLLVQKRLDSQLPSDVRVYTKNQFIEFEKDYWRSRPS
jgi:putative ABC transport system permease protein